VDNLAKISFSRYNYIASDRQGYFAPKRAFKSNDLKALVILLNCTPDEIVMTLNKSNLLLIILLTFFEITKAQRICPLDGNIGLLYLEKKGEVIIKTKHLGSGNYSYGEILRFKYIEGVVKCKTESLDSSDHGQDYEESNYYHYPEFIKIRNNGFLLSNKKGDSLIVDNKGRVIEVYRKTDNKATYAIIKFRYLNDTTVLETAINSSPRNSNNVTVYELDATFNLKAIKEGNHENNLFTMGINDIDVYSIKKVKYDRNNVRVNSIETYDVDDNETRLFSTQTFIYKNNKPVKSFLYDVKKKAVVYEQMYMYHD
jgi:hypothetical protein